MVKKNIETPQYVEANLKISKDKFVELLTAQIQKGENLLVRNVPITNSYIPYGGYVHNRDKVEYDEKSKNDFIEDFDRWHRFNKEIYRTSFDSPNNMYYHEYETSVGGHIFVDDLIDLYKKDIRVFVNHMKGDIEKIELIPCSVEENKESVNNSEKHDKKPPMVFISHSSKDKSFVESLVDLLEIVGLSDKNLFCSSVDGYGIKLSGDIFSTLRNLFVEYELFVIFVHSPRYYESPVCLNEMGAAWALKNDFCSILTSDMNYSDMKGVVNSSSISIKVDDESAPARLNELKDNLISFIGLDQLDQTKWERKRNRFIEQVRMNY